MVDRLIIGTRLETYGSRYGSRIYPFWAYSLNVQPSTIPDLKFLIQPCAKMSLSLYSDLIQLPAVMGA
jgi:hypothetical protein